MKNRVIEIPVHPVVKAYFEHPAILGSDAIVEKRHYMGRHISSVVSYVPLDPKELPVGITERELGKLEIFSLQVSFPLKTEQLTMHHLCLIGQVMESIFEVAILNFCMGRFCFSLNYTAAISDFFERYGLDKLDYDQDNYRRFVNKKYGSQIAKLYKEANDERDEQISKMRLGR
jgi:hypothetical protein